MALSTCMKCGNHRFEIKEVELSGSRYKNYFVQCSSCGGVVGVLPYTNTNILIEQLAIKLGVRLD